MRACAVWGVLPTTVVLLAQDFRSTLVELEVPVLDAESLPCHAWLLLLKLLLLSGLLTCEADLCFCQA